MRYRIEPHGTSNFQFKDKHYMHAYPGFRVLLQVKMYCNANVYDVVVVFGL